MSLAIGRSAPFRMLFGTEPIITEELLGLKYGRPLWPTRRHVLIGLTQCVIVAHTVGYPGSASPRCRSSR